MEFLYLFDDLPEDGPHRLGQVRSSATRANMAASVASVLAWVPAAWAKCLAWSGLTLASGSRPRPIAALGGEDKVRSARDDAARC